VELKGDDLSCYLNISNPLVYLKSLYDYYSLPAKRVLAISQWQTFLKSFTHKMAAKASLHQNYVAGHPMYCNIDAVIIRAHRMHAMHKCGLLLQM